MNILNDIEDNFFGANRAVRQVIQTSGAEKVVNQKLNELMNKFTQHLRKKIVTSTICYILPINPYVVQCCWDIVHRDRTLISIAFDFFL